MLKALVPLLLMSLVGCDAVMLEEVATTAVPTASGPGATDPSLDPVADPSAENPAPELPADLGEVVDNEYFPLEPGTVWIYEGDSEGSFRRDEVRALAEARVVQGVTCTTLVQEVYLDGALAEVTEHWFAQDGAGNVWQFGEVSVEYFQGRPVTTEDSWEAGVDGAVAWIFLSADPQVGDVFRRPGGPDLYTVLSLAANLSVPAGDFGSCLEALETNLDDPDDADRIIYGPGIGLVEESSPTGRIELVEIRSE